MILGGELAKNFPKGGNILPKSTLPEGGESQSKILKGGGGYPLDSFTLARV